MDDDSVGQTLRLLGVAYDIETMHQQIKSLAGSLRLCAYGIQEVDTVEGEIKEELAEILLDIAESLSPSTENPQQAMDTQAHVEVPKKLPEGACGLSDATRRDEPS